MIVADTMWRVCNEQIVRKIYQKNWELNPDRSTIELFPHINPTAFILLLQEKANPGI